MRLGRGRIAQNELHDAGELLDLQKGMAQTEFGHRPSGGVNHPSGRRVAAAEGLQDGLAARRRRFDRRRVGSDPQQPHHVKAPPARAWNRVGAPQRRERCAGQHRVHPAVFTCAPRRRQSIVQGDFAVADSPEAGEASSTDGMCLGFSLTVIATRGERLVLTRSVYSGHDQGSEAFHTEVLAVGEIDAAERITASITFDPDDIDAAFAELDARYLAGEAARYADAWSLIAQAIAAVNRHEIPPDDGGLGRHRPPDGIERSHPARARGILARHLGCRAERQGLHRGGTSVEQPRGGHYPGGQGVLTRGLRCRVAGGRPYHSLKATWSTASRYSTRQTSTLRSPGLRNSIGRLRPRAAGVRRVRR